jgi:NRAMP (natural resistance-associated macrophage protein)-like metal ion transporter
MTDRAFSPPRRLRLRLLAAWGPGLIVMLADTDAGSIITAAQSGVQWGYHLLLLQIILIPILFVVQEMTVRLGLVTSRGHGALIRERFGPAWAWLSVSTLALACIGALITELTGLAGVGLLFGVPVAATMTVTVGGIIFMVLTGSYRSVERVAVTFGLFELAFIWVAWRADPDLGPLAQGLLHAPLSDHSYLYLAAANIGAVIMPWMVFYQQSAVVEKGLRVADLRAARVETAVGAVLTQIIMAAVLVATAATIGRANPGAPLDTVQQISQALTPFLGHTAGRLVFAVGMSGAALVAAIVVSLTAAWGVGEVAGYNHSLAHRPLEAPWFYGIFCLSLVLGGALVASGIDLVRLSVGVQVLNALLLPIVLGFLFLLARHALPESHRLKGVPAAIVGTIVVVTAGFGLFAGIYGMF